MYNCRCTIFVPLGNCAKIAVVETIFRDQWFKFASLWQLIQQKPVLRRRCMLYLPRQILYLSGTKL